MRRLVVIDLLQGPAWLDASEMADHLKVGEIEAFLMIRPGSVEVVGDWADGDQVLRDTAHQGPSLYCRVWHTSEGRDRPTVHTVEVGEADLYEETLLELGFHTEPPEGIELRRDEKGAYWGYYI
jgi:hypothetical protein